MSIKDIWDEVQEDRKNKKELKKQQKLNKKKSRTGEQKAYIIFWVVFIIFIVFSCVFSSCSMLSCSGFSCEMYNFSALIGISDETIEELKKDVNKNDVMICDEIAFADWLKCVATFNNSNLDIITKNNLDKDKLNGELSSQDFILKGSEIGALYNKLTDVYASEKNIDVLNLQIVGDIDDPNKGIMESVVLMNLSDLLGVGNLPQIYLYTKSEVQILQDNLAILDSEIKINNISDNAQEEIEKFMANKDLDSLINISNETICDTMQSFAKLFDCKINIASNGFKFYN